MKNHLSLKVFLSLFAVCCLPFTGAGCGYTTRSMVNTKYRTIYVTPFVNKINITSEVDTGNKYRIYRPMIESDITTHVNNKFYFDGNLRPAKDSSADLILKGEVVEFRKDPLRYDANDNVAEYRINLVVNISLWDRRENKLLWQENGFTGDTSYFASGPQQKPEDTAVVDALKDLSRRIVERTVEQW
ncbi:MAG: LptE family protein [Candidatus Omnitrophica bacterium]|nr:LptE family protein [Candidatus Omnitrophota bacterium]